MNKQQTKRREWCGRARLTHTQTHIQTRSMAFRFLLSTYSCEREELMAKKEDKTLAFSHSHICPLANVIYVLIHIMCAHRMCFGITVLFILCSYM